MDKQIGEIEGNKTNKTVISLSKFRGRDVIDIRDFFKVGDMENWTPTKRGVQIPFTKVSELVSLCEKTEDAILEEQQ